MDVRHTGLANNKRCRGFTSADLHDWLRPRQAKYKVTLTDPFRKRAYHVEQAVWGEFLHMYFQLCESDDQLRFCEVAQPLTRLFFDIDTDRAWPGLKPRLEAQVNELFVGEWHASFAFRDNSENMFVVFPGLIVTKQALRAVWKLVIETTCADVDPAANGHRLVGAWSGDGMKDPYLPLHDDLTIRQQEMEDVATVCVDPRVPAVSNMKAFFPRMNGTQRKKLVRRPCRETQTFIVFIRSMHPKWANLMVDKATTVPGQGTFITVKHIGKTFCCNVDRAHTSNRIYFFARSDGLVEQRCFKCAGYRRVLGRLPLFMN